MKNAHTLPRVAWLALFLTLTAATISAQRQIGVPRTPLGDGPWVFDTAEQHKVRVSS